MVYNNRENAIVPGENAPDGPQMVVLDVRSSQITGRAGVSTKRSFS